MKTLHLANAWHESSGGIGTFYRALFEAANAQGHEMRLVVPSATTRIEACGRFGRIYHVQAAVAPFSPSYRILYPQRYLLPGSALVSILNDERPDLVEVSDKYTLHYLGGLLRTRRLPFVRFRPTVIGISHERMDENMHAYVSQSGAAQRFCRWYMRSIYFAQCDHHIAVSEHTAAELIDASHGHKVQRGIWIAPMGVDCERFRPQRRSLEKRREFRRTLGIADDTAVLFYAGRLAPEKNPGLLLDTMAKLPADRYWLAIAGEGILGAALRARCAESGIRNVTFLGQVRDREALADLYANADLFLHPNPQEPFGIAPLEAMASGLALVAPNRGGVTTYANGTNAWLADANPVAFAAAVRHAMEDPERENRMRAARATAERHRWPEVTAHFLQLFQEMHELTQGRADATSIAPRALSTFGSTLGRAARPQDSSSRFRPL